MPLIVLGISILLLLLLIARLKLNAFMALLLASFFVGLANHMTLEATLRSILEGIGDTAGSLMLILVFGAMLGKLTDVFGLRRIQLSICITGFIVGLPMIYTLSATTGLRLMYLGIPLSSARKS